MPLTTVTFSAVKHHASRGEWGRRDDMVRVSNPSLKKKTAKERRTA